MHRWRHIFLARARYVWSLGFHNKRHHKESDPIDRVVQQYFWNFYLEEYDWPLHLMHTLAVPEGQYLRLQ